jgi:hypothetical protein
LGLRLRELKVIEVSVKPATVKQGIVRALINDTTLIHYDNAVRVANGRQAMRDY